MNLKKISTIILLILLLKSCTPTPATTHSGITNLDQKHLIFIEGNTNKNDILKSIGDTLLKDYPDEKSWIYIETEIKKNIYGNKEIVKNNLLLLDFDNKGILQKKIFLNKNDMKKINFDDDIIETKAVTEGFSKKFLASMRKRFQALSKMQ